MTRIVMCCENYHPSVGGVQEVMRQIAERMAARGHEVTVATSSHPNRALDELINGVRVVSFDISGNAIRGIHGNVSEYRSFLLDTCPDVIMIKAAQQWTFDAAVEIIPQSKARKIFIPCGFSCLNDTAYADYYRAMPKWLEMFDALIFYSNAYQDIEFARRHGLTKNFVIPNGVDEREFYPSSEKLKLDRIGVADDELFLLSVGSLIVAKGHWEAVHAYANALIPQKSTFVINGNRQPEKQWRKFVRSLRGLTRGSWPLTWLVGFYNAKFYIFGKNKRIRLVDLPRDRLVSVYQSADLFVHASHVEYSPLVLFEAAAAGVPFVASDAGNANEIADWTGAGTIIPRTRATQNVPSPVDIYLLSKALEKCVGQTDNKQSLRKQLRSQYLQSGLIWQVICIQYDSVMHGII